MRILILLGCCCVGFYGGFCLIRPATYFGPESGSTRSSESPPLASKPSPAPLGARSLASRIHGPYLPPDVSSIAKNEIPLTVLRKEASRRWERLEEIAASERRANTWPANPEDLQQAFTANGPSYSKWTGRYQSPEGEREATFEILLLMGSVNGQFQCLISVYELEDGRHGTGQGSSCYQAFDLESKSFHFNLEDVSYTLLRKGHHHAFLRAKVAWPPPASSEVTGIHVDKERWESAGRLIWTQADAHEAEELFRGGAW